MTKTVQFPSISVPLADENGQINRTWQQFFYALYAQVGALAAAQAAQAAAQAAQATATTATTAAATAQTTANTAIADIALLGDTSTAVCDVSLPIGMPLAYIRATGHLTQAIASIKTRAFVVGLAQAATTNGFTATADNGPFVLPDWTPIAGTVSLTPGLPYFLAVSGGITATPPTSPNCLTLIGWAVGAQILRVEPEQPFQL